MKAKSKIRRVRFGAVVTRSNGEVDDYGVVMDSRWGLLRKWFARRRIERLNRKRGL